MLRVAVAISVFIVGQATRLSGILFRSRLSKTISRPGAVCSVFSSFSMIAKRVVFCSCSPMFSLYNCDLSASRAF